MITIRPARTEQDFETATAIQLTVFAVEQGIPEDTCRDGNADATHVLAFDGEEAVATGRLLVNAPAAAELARIAVIRSHRGKGIGGQVVIALEEMARASGIRRISLNPHQYLQSFYERLGYDYGGEPPTDVAGHRLITMSKQLMADDNA